MDEEFTVYRIVNRKGKYYGGTYYRWTDEGKIYNKPGHVKNALHSLAYGPNWHCHSLSGLMVEATKCIEVDWEDIPAKEFLNAEKK